MHRGISVTEPLAVMAFVASALLSGSCGHDAIEEPDGAEPIQYGVLDRTLDLSSLVGWTGGFDQDLWQLYFEDGSTYGNPLHKVSEWATADGMIELQVAGWPTVSWATSEMFDRYARQAAENLGVDDFEIATVGGYHCYEQPRSIHDGLVVLDVLVFDEKYHDVHGLSVFCDVGDLEKARSLARHVITAAGWKWIDRRLPLLGELDDDDLPPPEHNEPANDPV